MHLKQLLLCFAVLGLLLFSTACTDEFSCTDGKQNQGETGIDCGGPCPPCTNVATATCSDGIQNQGEEGVDCGGPCSACATTNDPSCSDGIQNQGEEGVDCGGPCPACETTEDPSCSDGIQNQGEEGVDCGGPCPACETQEPSCNDGIQNQDEEGVDCGGSCPACEEEPSCSDGIQNQGEAGVDCGGPCPNICILTPNCSGFVEDDPWTATEIIASMDMDSVLTIVASDDTWQFTITYSGAFEIGQYNIGETLTITIENLMTGQTCEGGPGFVEFTTFDTDTQFISGNFNVDCEAPEPSGEPFRVTDMVFENVEYEVQ